MPTTFFDRTVFKGGHGGATHRVQYITRTLPTRAEVQVRHQGLVEGTETQREDLVYWRARNLPAWTAGDAITFFSAAEQYTSPAWTAYEEWKFALPRELSRAQQMAAARDFLRSAFGEKHPHIWAMHDAVAADGGRQPHVHVLWSARLLDGVERSPAQFFRRADGKHPERGGAKVNRELTHFGAVKAARILYTDVMNLHLERAGIEARLHPERLEARGILREPEPRLSPMDSQALKRDGIVTPAMQEVFDHRKRYAVAKAREQRLALAYWEQRKTELGLERVREPAAALGRMQDARQRRARETPASPRRDRERVVVDHERTMRLAQPLVGNRESKIFHAPGDVRYGAVSPRKQVLFGTVAEAEASGYRAARNQHYGRGVREPRAFREVLVLPDALEEHHSGRAARVRVWAKDERREEREERGTR